MELETNLNVIGVRREIDIDILYLCVVLLFSCVLDKWERHVHMESPYHNLIHNIYQISTTYMEHTPYILYIILSLNPLHLFTLSK